LFDKNKLMKKKQKLIVIQGPTASGKTSLAIALAQHWNTIVFSADSRQFYKEIEIGTAKPNQTEQAGVKHYFIDSHTLEEELTAAKYAQQALPILNAEFEEHDYIILVGGSGLFIDALCNGLDNIPTSESLKEELNLIYENEGIGVLLEELHRKDPEFYQTIDKQNPMRVIRAVEAIRLSNQTHAELRTANKMEHSFDIIRFVLEHPREILYERINQRVDIMIQNGLIEEVKSVYDKKDLKSLKTVGYSEIFDYLEKKISLEEAINSIKQNTRRYAKRQLTWFRKNKENIWLTYTDTTDLANKIINQI
jgi:tRNA dimethylallyltransferase